ncbi:MAG TPA: hypothetical protein VGV60_09865 [Candidatus Polarisedimenticolia bacterium]|jgi:hypothetical protein|nr:hypothetical protein [Candidatus Polarisedimenticolia bacterium]
MLQRGFPEPLVLVLLQQELHEVLDLGEIPSRDCVRSVIRDASPMICDRWPTFDELADPGRQVGGSREVCMRPEESRRAPHVLQPADLGQHLRELPRTLGVRCEEQLA